MNLENAFIAIEDLCKNMVL